MNHARHPITRLAVLVTAIPGLLAVTAVRTTAMVPPPDPGGPGSSPGRLARAPAQPVAGNPDWTLRWVLLAAVGVGWYPSVDEACAATVTVQPVAEPGGAAGYYDTRHPTYQALYPALRFYGREGS